MRHFFILCFLLNTLTLSAQVCQYKQSDFEHENKMDWWHDAHFGMFIHWGVYSVFGNIYEGKDVNGNQIKYDVRTSGNPSEWIMHAAKIPRSVYRDAAKEFDAKDYDPKKWVEIAKNAGMKYIVITSKHHDGFCLFKTQHTDWNAVDASAAKRDLLKDLVVEAKAAGLKIGFYYSQNLDWMHEGGMGNIPELNGEMYPIDKVRNYVNTIVVPHIQELTNNYDIDIFWFDSPWASRNDYQINQQILNALLNSPVGNKIIYNDRLYPDFKGDFITQENDTPYVPYNGFSDDRAWESCVSLNNSWGYEREPDKETVWNNNRWKTGYYAISRILEIVSKGGNFLLNVGPDMHGNIPERAVKILQEVGEWMNIYGETIYGTRKNTLINPFEYGYVTQKTENDESVHLYLHISTAFCEEGEIVVNGITELPVSSTLFDSKKPVECRIEDNNLVLTLPDKCSNPYYVTVDLHFREAPSQVLECKLRDNKIRLTPFQAITHHVSKNFFPYALTSWFYTYSEVEFNVYLEKGEYTLDAEYSCWNQGGELYFNIDNKDYTAFYENTGNPSIADDVQNYITSELLEKINIPVSKKYSIIIHRNAEIPNVTNWINVRSFTFKKITETGIEKIYAPVFQAFVKDRYIICESPVEQPIKIYDSMGRLRKIDTIGLDKKVYIGMFEPGTYIIQYGNFTQKIII